ncbi:2Fe-2S iron-sulfur cluster-binding protein [Simplicispira suum]|uniref:2Fe-2S iron-sulfur cluster-binding protein n=1 Tax=Simplicispira suum TaxID=2109915 RepID=UPI001D2EC8E2|nr:2Fe-2S iron-sulfur cluster-binding protein [Simplicispira suum]MCB1980336.1 (2Fe-2S)-binding protein [Burkholderiaceae bacterium]MCO5104297.1 (2Fe-2S)-binding protein [Burkholderiaceae bacterium]
MSPAIPMVEVQLGEAWVRVPAGSSAVAALAQQPPGRTRLSVTGQWRAPLCGMGVCHECRVLIDGRERLACQTICEDGMHIATSTAQSAGAA